MPAELKLWTAKAPLLTRVPYAELASGRVPHDELLRAIADPGVVIVEGKHPQPPRGDNQPSVFSGFWG